MSGEEDVCGETYDHLISASDWEYADGVGVAVCRRCGAELWSDAPE